MPVILDVSVTDADAHGIHVGAETVRLGSRRRSSGLSGWTAEETEKQPEAPNINVDVVTRQTEETADYIAHQVAQRSENGMDSGVVLYGAAPGDANNVLFDAVCATMCRALRPRMLELEDAQDAARRVQQYQAEQQLSHSAALAKRRASLSDLEKQEGLNLPRPPPVHTGSDMSAAAQGLQRRLSSRRQSRDSDEALERQGSKDKLQRAASGSLSSRRGSLVIAKTRPRRDSAADKFRDAVRRASLVTDEGDAAAGTAPDAPPVDTRSDPLQRIVQRAAQREGVTTLKGKEGHHGMVPSAHFDGRLTHIELRNVKGIGKEVERLGVEMWIRSTETSRKMTLLQLLGNKMEMVQMMLNQGLQYETAPGVLYCRVKDQLFNELEVVVDTNDAFSDGKWHHMRWVVDDLQEDKSHFWLDGAPIRVKIGAHSCPYKFDGWGDGDDGDGEVFGALGADWKALRGEAHTKPTPFKGEMAEVTIWGGERVLNYWPLTQRSLSKGAFQRNRILDLQGNSEAEVKEGLQWKLCDWPTTSLLFDGTNYVNCGTMGRLGTELSDSITIDVWFTTRNADRQMSLLHVTDNVGKQQVIQIGINTNEKGMFEAGSIYFKIRDREGRELTAACRTSVNPCDGKWHRLLWVLFDVSANSMRVELDGHATELKMGRLDAPSKFADFSEWICLGGHNNHGAGVDSFFDGSLKAFKVWEGRGRARLLLAYLKLDEGPGATIAVDSSGNGHNGIISRCPPSNQDRAVRSRSSFGQSRRASISNLLKARDVSHRHAAWLPLPQPHVNDQDIEEERQRRRLLVKAHNMMATGQAQDTCLRVAALRVQAQEEQAGVWGEVVVDLLHGELPVELGHPSHGDFNSDMIPQKCFEDTDSKTIGGIFLRLQAQRNVSGGQGHQIVVLWLGSVRVMMLQLHGRPVQHKLLQPNPLSKLEWQGPVMLAGPQAKARHVLLKGVQAMEALLTGTGLSTPRTVFYSSVKAQIPVFSKLWSASTVTRCIEHIQMRQFPETDLLVAMCVQDRDQLVTTMKLVDYFEWGVKRLAAVTIQRVFRGHLVRLATMDMRCRGFEEQTRDFDTEFDLIIQSLAANADWILLKVYYRKLLRMRNIRIADRRY